MLIKWLLSKIARAQSRPDNEPAHRPTLEQDGYEIADSEPPLSPELKAAAEQAGSLSLEVNRLIRAASVETDPTRKQQHIKSAREALAAALTIIKTYPALKPRGLDAVMETLDQMGQENRQAPDTQQAASQTPDDWVLGSLASLFRVINESISIATNTKNADTFASRLDVAEKSLERARKTAQDLGRGIEGVSDAKAAIEALKRRGPPEKDKKNRHPTNLPNNLKPPTAPTPENTRPPELDISPWMHVAPEDTGIFSAESWASLRDDLRSGNFWADRAKDSRENPAERLRLGLENLPLPGAFKECAIAIRALIRAAKKVGQPIEGLLSLLYWLAAINSFAVPYSKRLGAPGYIAMEMASGAEVAGLPFTYNALGYEYLELLTITDVKTMVMTWGVPENHTTLHDMHKDFWAVCEDRAAKQSFPNLDDMLPRPDTKVHGS